MGTYFIFILYNSIAKCLSSEIYIFTSSYKASSLCSLDCESYKDDSFLRLLKPGATRLRITQTLSKIYFIFFKFELT